ncbi:hypothetical protein LshimejAT787_0110870 [Lyophyllum shimeji]|uniref:Uncharacterized protein n=1 Tax=Lyophyllum shimeji TaxID=47721 RepID=A0A9P3PEY4_LYOSH|nr:hypothetical protein LshimejAT787_0110870 [Lyophyllum shimeji]
MSSNPRRTHRKRASVLRLSSDTTSTLPEYITVGGWSREDDDSDQPPDYPDSAEEADEDTDSDGSPASKVYVPPLPHVLPSARPRGATDASRRTRTRTRIGGGNRPTRTIHEVLETSARGLSMRIQGRDKQAKWAEDLAEISRGVDGLFDDSRLVASSSTTTIEQSISCSLPSSSPPPQLYRQRRRPSMLELRHTSDSQPHLHLSYGDRSDLVSPPPRAVTQYVASTADRDAITLPSTLGLRVPSSTHSAADRRPSSEMSTLHAPLSSPRLTDRPLEPSTPAYNMLSSIRHSTNHLLPVQFTAQLTKHEHKYRAERYTPTLVAGYQEVQITRYTAHRHARPLFPLSHAKTTHHDPPHRPMTPPTEESSSSSSETCTTKRTILSLRRILDEQPAPVPRAVRPPPFLLPRTPAPVAEAETSTATASISRLFTKAKHSSSTRPPSPPRVSAMKHPSPAGSQGVRARRLRPRLRRSSTPKRISFAELPESYAGTRPGGGSTKFRDKKGRRGKERVGKGKGEEQEAEGSVGSGWWSGWLVSPGGLGAGGYGAGAARHEERMEDRLSRNWGGRMAGTGFGSSGLDEWAM